MVPVSKVTDGTYMIDVQRGVPTMSVTAYLVMGHQAALIEAGPSVAAPLLLEGMRQIGYNPAHLAYVIVTHVHVDHAGGVGALAQALPQAQVIVHRRGARHLVDPSRLIESTRQVQGENFDKVSGPILPVAEDRVSAVAGGDVVSLGGRDLNIVNAPGHAPHHICIHDSQTNGLFSGDALGILDQGGERPLPVVVPPSYDLEAHIDTLRQIRKLAPSVLFFSHFGPPHGVKQLIDMVEQDIAAYGRIVLAAVKDKASLAEIERRLEARRSSLGARYDVEPDFKQMITGFIPYFKRTVPGLEWAS
jgi:glyoxylase-like metal-dependent hydrolase (beta-lactamase superfamily II)